MIGHGFFFTGDLDFENVIWLDHLVVVVCGQKEGVRLRALIWRDNQKTDRHGGLVVKASAS